MGDRMGGSSRGTRAAGPAGPWMGTLVACAVTLMSAAVAGCLCAGVPGAAPAGPSGTSTRWSRHTRRLLPSAARLHEHVRWAMLRTRSARRYLVGRLHPEIRDGLGDRLAKDPARNVAVAAADRALGAGDDRDLKPWMRRQQLHKALSHTPVAPSSVTGSFQFYTTAAPYLGDTGDRIVGTRL